jgi:integrase
MEGRFVSILCDELEAFVAMKELVCKDHRAYRHDLLSLDAHLASEGLARKELDPKAVRCWMDTLDIAPSTKQGVLTRVRLLSRYLKALGISAGVPEIPRPAKVFQPYVFTVGEMDAIFKVADELSAALPGSAAAIELPMILRILYGCGMRLGEALSLRWEDVDLDCGVIIVREAKNETQRLVPVDNSLTEVLALYRAVCGRGEKDGGYLFCGRSGGSRPASTVRHMFESVLNACDIVGAKPEKSRSRGPCLHSLRHTFCLNSLVKTEAEGWPFLESVPFLSTYLGHRSLSGTDKYLNARYELYQGAHTKIAAFTADVFPGGD